MIHGRTDYNLIQDVSPAKRLAMYILNLEPSAEQSQEELDELGLMKDTASQFLASLPPHPPKAQLSIAEDEPVFLLRAQDATASHIVRQWASTAHAMGSPDTIVAAALGVAQAMEDWQVRQVPDMPKEACPEDLVIDHGQIAGLTSDTKILPDTIVVTKVKSTPKLYTRKMVTALTQRLAQVLGCRADEHLVLMNGWEVLKGDMPLDTNIVTYGVSMQAYERQLVKKLPSEFELSVAIGEDTVVGQVRLVPMAWTEAEVDVIDGIAVPALAL